jgi:outer membrane protein assembly factor BamB
MDLENSTARKPLRLWPGIVAVALQCLLWIVIPIVAPEAVIYAVLGGVAGGLIVLVWWLFFSRAPWSERVGAIVVMVVAVFATRFVVHRSIENGMMGMMLPIYSIPVLSFALVVWAWATRHFSNRPRRAAMVAAILLACGVFTLLRTGGISGEGVSELHWRWTLSPEERLLAERRDEFAAPLDTARGGPAAAPAPATAPEATSPVTATPAAPVKTAPATNASASEAATSAKPVAAEEAKVAIAPPADPRVAKREAEWPGFRGRERDGVVRGVAIETDWSRSAPIELWRRPIGPGWSSFAVNGNVIYTQEQRGEEELVTAYNLTTGAPVWAHRDPIRFYESNGGAGPRGTPTLSNGRVHAMGATGLVNVLDARDGKRIWSANAAKDTEVTVPDWGVASSPLVIDDIVVVAVSGRLVGYDIATGKLRWLGPSGGTGYSSPHLFTIDGVPQVLLLRGSRTISVAPADGKLLWEHQWDPGVSIVQPALAANGDLLITVGDAMGGNGMRRLAVKHGPGGWAAEERWTSRGLKPYFNDFVVHEGHAFGFDGSILSCIDLNDGTRKWKGGRYGHGQMILLADQDLLLVLSEEGELALVSATPDKHTEIARFPVLDAKTWNHPVLVGDVLLVRNGEEMAAFRLPRNSKKDTLEEK